MVNLVEPDIYIMSKMISMFKIALNDKFLELLKTKCGPSVDFAIFLDIKIGPTEGVGCRVIHVRSNCQVRRCWWGQQGGNLR